MTNLLPSDWDEVFLPTALDSLRPLIRPAVKIAKRDYQVSGRFPVIDQGQKKIAGWTDNQDAVLRSSRPVVVFGDHSRTFKYVDHPFAAV